MAVVIRKRYLAEEKPSQQEAPPTPRELNSVMDILGPEPDPDTGIPNFLLRKKWPDALAFVRKNAQG